MLKYRTLFAASLALALLASGTSGCGVAAQFFPTPTPPPTRTPTITPTPLPDISAAVLKLEDLPSGFQKVNPEDLGITEEVLRQSQFDPQNVFTFLNGGNFQMIFGFNMLLEKSVDQILFDASVSQPEKTLPVLLKNMGAAKVSHEKVLTGMDDIGDARIAMSAVVDAAGIPMQVDILMFRRGPIMLFIFSYVLEGQKPNITVHSLGVKADARAQSTLETLH